MKKKLILAIAMILCVAFLLSLASCSRKKKENETTKGTEQTSAQVNDATATEDDDKSNDVSESVTESDEVSNTSAEETTLGVYDSQGEAGSGFEITGEEITLPGVSADDDND